LSARQVYSSAVAASVFLCGLVCGSSAGRRPMAGMTFAAWTPGGYAAPEATQQLGRVRELGVDTVAIVARGYQDGRRATEVHLDPALAASAEEVRGIIRVARGLGMQVMLKPQLDFPPGYAGWRGEIEFDREEDWRAWFESYSVFMSAWAEMAESEGVSILCIGVELDATRHREADWRGVVARMRKSFSGSLTYAANWDRETDIRWWDALDYIGVDAYYPLGEKDDPTVEDLRAAWLPHIERLRSCAEEWGKPILVTELGYRSAEGAATQPWEWEITRPVRLDLQARLYEAALGSLFDQPWFAGAFWWFWSASPIARPDEDDDFTVQGKPAEEVVRRFYGRLRPPRRP